jgi:hypothetical protein
MKLLCHQRILGRIAQAGFTILVFDYGGWDPSEGELRSTGSTGNVGSQVVKRLSLFDGNVRPIRP